MMSRTHNLALLAALLLGLAGCNSTDNPSTASPVQTDDPVARIMESRWEWISLTTPVEQIAIENPERYFLEFTPDGGLGGKADCNQLFGRYTVDGHRMTIEGIGTTKMLCPPGSHFDRFVRDLGQVAVFSFLDNGDLILELPADSGTLRFRAAGVAGESR